MNSCMISYKQEQSFFLHWSKCYVTDVNTAVSFNTFVYLIKIIFDKIILAIHHKILQREQMLLKIWLRINAEYSNVTRGTSADRSKKLISQKWPASRNNQIRAPKTILDLSHVLGQDWRPPSTPWYQLELVASEIGRLCAHQFLGDKLNVLYEYMYKTWITAYI